MLRKDNFVQRYWNRFEVCLGRFAAFLLTVTLLAAETHAETIVTPNIEVELVSEVSSVKPGEHFAAALRMRPAPGWHIYWQYPGDSGAPPKIKWNIGGTPLPGTLHWPTPERIPFGPLVNYGYAEETFLIADLAAPKELTLGSKATLSADAEWLVCQEECIPGDATLSLTLPVEDQTPAPNAQWRAAFDKTRTEWPVPSTEVQISAKYEKGRYLLQFSAPREIDRGDFEATFFPLHGGLIENAAPQKLTKSTDPMVLELEVDRATNKGQRELEGVLVANHPWAPGRSSRGILFSALVQGVTASTSESPGKASQTATHAAASNATSDPFANTGFGSALFFAFLGGLILNLMPCVFPILSIKILGFVENAEKEGSHRVAHSLVFALGVILSFLGLAAAIIILQAAGTKLGWGFQLQSPAFVVGTALLMFAIALNMLGLFEVGYGLQNASGKVGLSNGLFGSFVSGVIATAVATPCTAPFMGSAVAFALTLPPIMASLIFLSLGVGMAAPYVLLTLSPTVLKLLPRPGNWMVIFRQLMAFPLFATVIWLAWVLSLQTSTSGVLGLMSGLLVLLFGLWFYGQFGSVHRSSLTRRCAQAIALVSAAAALWTAWPTMMMEPNQVAAQGYTDPWGQHWETFSPEALALLRAKNTPVYLDFTAAWCITCQVNKRLVFSSNEVRDLIKSRKIVLMRADWTNRDERISAALNDFGRRGVPLNVIYKDGASEPTILPSILTASTVKEALALIGAPA